MIVGLDIDGTITRHPEFFAFLSRALKRAGHKVVVITFREDRQNAASDLAQWGVAYSKLVTWSHQENDCAAMDQWKGKVCGALNVELLFDDDPQVIANLSANVVGLMVGNPESRFS